MQTLADVCLRHNLTPPLDQFPGGDYRIDDPEKTGQGDGFLYLFADGEGGFIQNHRKSDRGETFFFSGHGAKLNPDQKKELRKQLEAQKQLRARLAEQAAQLAFDIWCQASPATPDHPYLVRKNIQSLAPQLRVLNHLPHNVPRSLRFLQLPILIAPIVDADGRPMTAEYIDALGEKRYHTDGSREAGLAWVLRGEWDKGPVYLAEGLSTACSVADATGRPCCAAFDAGNLPKVAAALRRRYPAMVLVICADDDVALEKAKKPNKGLLKAQEACSAGGGLSVVVPDFSKLRERGDWSDFNDMATLLGLEAVGARLDLSSLPSAEAPAWLKDDPLQELRLFGFGEADIASVFARLRERDLRWVSAWGTWMHYQGGVWDREKTEYGYDMVGQLCMEVARRGQEQNAKGAPLRAAKTRGGVERIARADRRLAGVTDQWDRHDWALNTPAGVVDLRTGELGLHRPDMFLTHQTSVIPDWVTPTPVWSKFIYDVCCGDGDLAAYLQRLAGYCLTGVTYEQVLVFFYGAGRNGKGTFLDTLKFIMKGYYQAAAADTFTESKSDRHKSELAVLMGARLVTASEVGQGKAWNDSRIKELTGQDTITANFMRCDPFTFTPNFKLIISSNNKPRFNNVDPAIRARLQLVPWLANFEQSGTKDPLMRDKLQAEAAGILAWAIDGCTAWQRFGLQPPKAVREATQTYLDAEDLEAQWFEEFCVVERGAKELLVDLFKSWTSYAEVRHGRQKRDRELADRLERDGFEKHKDKYGVHFKGMRLKNASERLTLPTNSAFNVVPFKSPII